MRAESTLFTLVGPDRGWEVAYNDWYELDHQFSGALSGEGWFSGRRWLAPQRLKKLRFATGRPAIDPIELGSTLSVYWREEGYARASERWAIEMWHRLNAENRLFEHRKHIHSTSYEHVSTVTRPNERVPLELALQHPFTGLLVLIVDGGDAAEPDVVARLEALAPETHLRTSGALLATWHLLDGRGDDHETTKASILTASSNHLLQMAFLRGDPEDVWEDVRAYAEQAGSAGVDVQFCAGFIPTVPGPTEHLDEL